MKRYVHFPKVEGQASRQAHADLPAGTPDGLVGTSGFYKRESFPGYVVTSPAA